MSATEKVDHSYRDYSSVKPGASLGDSNQEEGGSPTNRKKKKCRGTNSNFPTKLHQILSRSDQYSDIVAWNPHGRSWRVLKPQLFIETVVPRYFSQSNYSSFTRQVTGWGFKRLTRGPDINSYYHELFLRGMPHLVQHMRRPTPCGKLSPDPDNEPNFYGMSWLHPLPKPNKCSSSVSSSKQQNLLPSSTLATFQMTPMSTRSHEQLLGPATEEPRQQQQYQMRYDTIEPSQQQDTTTLALIQQHPSVPPNHSRPTGAASSLFSPPRWAAPSLMEAQGKYHQVGQGDGVQSKKHHDDSTHDSFIGPYEPQPISFMAHNQGSHGHGYTGSFATSQEHTTVRHQATQYSLRSEQEQRPSSSSPNVRTFPEYPSHYSEQHTYNSSSSEGQGDIPPSEQGCEHRKSASSNRYSEVACSRYVQSRIGNEDHTPELSDRAGHKNDEGGTLDPTFTAVHSPALQDTVSPSNYSLKDFCRETFFPSDRTRTFSFEESEATECDEQKQTCPTSSMPEAVATMTSPLSPATSFGEGSVLGHEQKSSFSIHPPTGITTPGTTHVDTNECG